MALSRTKKKEVKTAEKQPLYAAGSAGEIKTYTVEPRIVAILMAIVAEQTEIPLNQLRFISIKEIT